MESFFYHDWEKAQFMKHKYHTVDYLKPVKLRMRRVLSLTNTKIARKDWGWATLYMYDYWEIIGAILLIHV